MFYWSQTASEGRKRWEVCMLCFLSYHINPQKTVEGFWNMEPLNVSSVRCDMNLPEDYWSLSSCLQPSQSGLDPQLGVPVRGFWLLPDQTGPTVSGGMFSPTAAAAKGREGSLFTSTAALLSYGGCTDSSKASCPLKYS